MSIAGSGGIDAKGIAVDTASVSIAGSGDIDAQASNTAAVSIMGSGNVELTGGAKCTVCKAGSGQRPLLHSDLLTIAGESGGMNRTAALALLSSAVSSQAIAAERTLSVTTFDRVRIDGPYKVKVATGVSPFAKVSGSPAAIDGVSVDQQGRTLIIRNNPSAWGGYQGKGRGPVEISVGTPDLSPPGSTARDRSPSTRSRDCRSTSPFRAAAPPPSATPTSTR